MPAQLQTFGPIPSLSVVPNPRDPDQQRYDDTTYTFELSEKALYDSLAGDFVPKVNALIGVLNAELEDINTVADADAAIRAVYTAITQVNTVSEDIESVTVCATWMDKIKLVAENMAEVLSAQGYAEEAKKWALMAEAVTNVKPATKETLGLVIVGDGVDVDIDGKISVPPLSEALLPAHASRHGASGNDPITSLGPVSEKTQSLGAISGSVTIDLSAGLSVSATVDGAVTLTFSNVPTDGTVVMVLRLTNGGSAVVTWPLGVRWPRGTAPVLTESGVDLVILTTSDGGSTWMGTANIGYAE
uniref:hypothetical protein n=1 Tax=uncultured Bilophila sp. TaxID=529385 RepID=UPI0025FA9472|nr:hypothetical protein [uncultured Bilophila sp.]